MASPSRRPGSRPRPARAPVTTSTAAYSATTVLWDPEASGGFQTTAAGSSPAWTRSPRSSRSPTWSRSRPRAWTTRAARPQLAQPGAGVRGRDERVPATSRLRRRPPTAEQVSTAFSHALRRVPGEIKARRADQQQAQLEGPDRGLKEQGATPPSSPRSELGAVPARAGSDGADLAHDHPGSVGRAGDRSGLQAAEEPSRTRAPGRAPRPARGDRARARPGALRHADPDARRRRGRRSRCRCWRRSPTSRDGGGSRW